MGRVKRQSSLHITRQQLEEIIETLEERGTVVLQFSRGAGKRVFYDELMKLASSRSIHHRSITITNNRVEKKARKLIATDNATASLLSQLLQATRKKLKHRGIKLITPGMREWDLVRTITENAVSFCNENNLEVREGMILYLKLGIESMNRYSLPKLSSIHELISETYGSIIELERDPTPELTARAIQKYTQIIQSKIGIIPDYLNRPEKKVFFAKVAATCKEQGVTPENYINAQFEALSFVDGVPDPAQLIGPKASSRVAKYLYENNKGMNLSSDPEPQVDFNKLKKLK